MALNAKKLQQIQDFEHKAFGNVSADAFYSTLLNIESTVVPIMAFVKHRINQPVFGYNILNRYTAGAMIVSTDIAGAVRTLLLTAMQTATGEPGESTAEMGEA